MLTRHAKAYSSSCLQIALVYLQPFCRNSLLKCAVQLKITKKTIKTIIYGVYDLKKLSMLIRLKSVSLRLVVTNSIYMLICNHFMVDWRTAVK